MTDIVERLREYASDWRIRTGSVNVVEEAAAEITSLRSALATAEAEIERLTEKAIVGEYMWTPEELGEAVATARKEAIEDAINAVKSAAPGEIGEWSVHRAWALGAIPALEQIHAAAIRAIAEKTGGKP
jgi:FAD/FMN-containing dehydrogenase